MDGRYEFDLAEYVETSRLREWGWIKKLSGYLPVTIGDGLDGADAELIGRLAVDRACSATGRSTSGRSPTCSNAWCDSPYTAVTIEFERTADKRGG